MRTDPFTRRPSAVLGRISGLSADCATVLAESSVRLAFWADFEPRPGRFGASYGAVRPSKIVLPPTREANFHFFALSRSFDLSDRLLDPILGPLGAVLGPVLGLLGLSWALLGGRIWRAEGRTRPRGALWSYLVPCSVFLGPFLGPFRGLWGPFRRPLGPLSVHFRSPFAVLRLNSPIHRTRQNMLTRTSAHADPHAVLC